MLNFDNQRRDGRLFGIELAGLDKEIRRDRLVSCVLWGSAPFIALNFFYQSVATVIIFQTYLLTSLEFGYIFLVEEFDSTKERWFSKAMVPLVLLHLAVLAVIFSWDNANPLTAGTGWALVSVLSAAALIEFYFMRWVIRICKPTKPMDKRDVAGRVGHA